jgi:hypothetical protein
MGSKLLALPSIDGCPIPEDGHRSDITQRLLDYWPVWDLQEDLAKDGIEITSANFRPGWVKLHIDWHGAEGKWKQKLTAMIIRDIVALAANKQNLYFNHWQVVRPPHLDMSAWTETLTTASREAIVYFRTFIKRQKSISELLSYIQKEEVNSIILANAFSLMEKEGVHDQD